MLGLKHKTELGINFLYKTKLGNFLLEEIDAKDIISTQKGKNCPFLYEFAFLFIHLLSNALTYHR